MSTAASRSQKSLQLLKYFKKNIRSKYAYSISGLYRKKWPFTTVIVCHQNRSPFSTQALWWECFSLIFMNNLIRSFHHQQYSSAVMSAQLELTKSDKCLGQYEFLVNQNMNPKTYLTVPVRNLGLNKELIRTNDETKISTLTNIVKVAQLMLHSKLRFSFYQL